MKPSKTSQKQAINIYEFIIGHFAKTSPKSDIKELAEYLDTIKKNARKGRKQK